MVARVAGVVPAKPIAPILAGIRLEYDPPKLRVSAFDFESSVETVCEADGDPDAHAVVVSGRLLIDIAKVSTGEYAELATNDNSLALACGATTYELPLMPEEYPQLPPPPEIIGDVGAGVFASAVEKVVPAVSTSGSMPALAGVYLTFDDDTLLMRGCDRWRLATCPVRWNSTKTAGPATVPADFMQMAARRLDGRIQLAHDDVTFAASSDSGVMTARLIAHEYPVPRVAKRTAEPARVNRAELLSAIKRIAPVVAKNVPVRLEFTPQGVELFGGTESRAREKLSAEVSEDRRVFANPGYLTDGLKGLSGEVAEFRFNKEPDKPFEIFEENYSYIMMPIKEVP